MYKIANKYDRNDIFFENIDYIAVVASALHVLAALLAQELTCCAMVLIINAVLPTY